MRAALIKVFDNGALFLRDGSYYLIVARTDKKSKRTSSFLYCSNSSGNQLDQPIGGGWGWNIFRTTEAMNGL